MFSEMEILHIPFILSVLCRITLHSVLGMIGRDLWVAGRIHTQPPCRATCFLDLQGSLWCSGDASRLRHMNCGLCLSQCIKSITRPVLCVFTLLFMVCFLSMGQWGQSKEKLHLSLCYIELGMQNHGIWNWRYQSRERWGLRIYPTSIQNDVNTCQVPHIPCEQNKLYYSEKILVFHPAGATFDDSATLARQAD